NTTFWRCPSSMMKAISRALSRSMMQWRYFFRGTSKADCRVCSANFFDRDSNEFHSYFFGSCGARPCNGRCFRTGKYSYQARRPDGFEGRCCGLEKGAAADEPPDGHKLLGDVVRPLPR